MDIQSLYDSVMDIGRRTYNAGNRVVGSIALNMTPQEQYLWSHHTGNVDLGGYQQPTGGHSSLYATTQGIDDRTYVLPTIYDAQPVEPDEALRRAMAAGIDKFPSYATLEEANARYNRMHDFMENDIFKRK